MQVIDFVIKDISVTKPQWHVFVTNSITCLYDNKIDKSKKKIFHKRKHTHTHTSKKKAKTNKQTMQKQGIRTNARKTPLSVTHGDEWKISEQDQSWVMSFVEYLFFTFINFIVI
jgi:UDP-2,3-diacylglucosamine pyrophosphatase LpxH